MNVFNTLEWRVYTSTEHGDEIWNISGASTPAAALVQFLDWQKMPESCVVGLEPVTHDGVRVLVASPINHLEVTLPDLTTAFELVAVLDKAKEGGGALLPPQQEFLSNNTLLLFRDNSVVLATDPSKNYECITWNEWDGGDTGLSYDSGHYFLPRPNMIRAAFLDFAKRSVKRMRKE